VPDAVTRPRLEAFAKKYKLTNFVMDIYNDWDEEQGIAAYASTVKTNLIALATNSKRGLAHLMDGSLAENVVNHNPGMVWTYSLRDKDVAVK
jgi:hypothetical protein